MTVGQFISVSGTVSSDEDLVIVLDNVLVQMYGWELVYKHTDTTDREYSWISEGEVSDKYLRLFSTVRANANIVYFKGYSLVDDSGTRSDEVHDATENRVNPGGPDWDFWINGNKDSVFITVRNSSNQVFTGGMGYLSTIHSSVNDPYPMFVLGQNSYVDTFNNTYRLASYVHDSLSIAKGDGVSGGPYLASTTNSGSWALQKGKDHSGLTNITNPDGVSGSYVAFPKVVYRTLSDGLRHHGVRGYVPNMWSVGNNIGTTGDYVSASGVLFSTGEDTGMNFTFFVADEATDDDNTYLIGPITAWEDTDYHTPHEQTGLQLYLGADTGVERRGGAFSGGRASRWRDRSYLLQDPAATQSNRNDAVQSTNANQPEPINEVLNSLPVLRFTAGSSHHMTGTVDIDNDMTLFAVASYRSGTTRAPIINIRGDVSATDTLFALEFNENNNNAFVALNNADGGVDREEVGSLTADTHYIITNTVSGTTTTAYVNGWSGDASTITDTKGSVASTATLNYSLGVDLNSGGSTGSNYASADIAEVIVYDRYLTNEERQAVWCMLSSKYNITVSGTC